MGEAAVKEARRRAQVRANGVHASYTDQDLKSTGKASGTQYGMRADAPEAVPSPSPAPASRTQMDSTFELRRIAEASWRRQAQEARDRLERARGAYDSVKDQWRNPTSRCSLTTLQGRVEQTRRELAAAQKGLDDLEQSARRAGVPPGWLR
jgi:hypothetical protein